MYARTLSTLFFFLITACLPVEAQVRQITGGSAPSALFRDSLNGHVHMISAGSDTDFDGLYEPADGDRLPGWYLVDPVSERITDSTIFDSYFNSFPLRFGIDWQARRLYVPQSGRVRSYNIDTRALVDDTVALGACTGVSFDPISGLLLLHMRPSFSEPGYLVGFDPRTGDTLGIVATGINPQMSVATVEPDGRTIGFYTLNEGTFGQPNASIGFYTGHPDIYQGSGPATTPFGGGGVHMARLGEQVYIVMGGTHEIRVMRSYGHRQDGLSRIDVGTTGFDGPRALAFDGDSVLVVGTYASDLRRFDRATGRSLGSIAMPGRVEALAVRDSIVFAAIKYTAGTYDADSAVAVVDMRSGSVIDTITTPLDPGAMLLDRRGNLHVIGYGADSASRWWNAYDGQTFALLGSRRLSGDLGFPLRVGYDSTADSLYIVLSDTLYAFSAAGLDAPSDILYVDSTASGNLTGVTVADGYLLVNELPRNFSSDPGRLHVLKRGGERVAKFLAGPFLTMAIPVPVERAGVLGIYALNEGLFGSATSSLTYFGYSSSIFGETLGSGANHLQLLPGSLAGLVTMNGDHNITAFTLSDWEIVQRIPTFTTLSDGPRESLLYGEETILVTTYAGDLRAFDRSGMRTFATGGKSEGLVIAGGKVFTAVPSNSDYSPASITAVIDLGTVSVDREDVTAVALLLEQNVPNPAVASTRIRFTLPTPGHVALALYGMDGSELAKVVDSEMQAGTYTVTLDASTLPPGSYIYRLSAGTSIESRLMKVVR